MLSVMMFRANSGHDHDTVMINDPWYIIDNRIYVESFTLEQQVEMTFTIYIYL